MHSDYQQDDDPRAFWRGLALACLLGGTAWLGGALMTAFVLWRVGRLG